MQTDGNLVLYGPSGALWDAHTAGHGGARLAVQDDCNLVIYASNGAVLWSTGTACRAEIGVVSGRIYRTYSNGRPSWTLGQQTAIDDLRRLGARWVRIEIAPDCSGAVIDTCEPAGTYERLVPALRSNGLKVLALVSAPALPPNDHPPPGGADAWWSTYYEPRIEHVLSAFPPDAIEIINEPNNNGFSAADFALIVKRTYERLHDVMHVKTPIVAGGILNAYDDATTHDQYHRDVANSTAYRDYLAVYGRLPMDGWGIHPYQVFDWSAGSNPSNMGAFLAQALQNIRSIIFHPEVPFWVTEFGWQHSDSCADTPGCGACGPAPDQTACDSRISSMMASSFAAFRDPSLHVATALWYDYRDDELSGGAQFGLRQSSFASPAYRVKPEWTTFQQIAGGAGAPTSP